MLRHFVFFVSAVLLARSQFWPQTINANYWGDLRYGHERKLLQLYYESRCPSCIEFDPEFVDTVLRLKNYVDFRTYPYGNAEMIDNTDGSITVKCQHGEPECYGNKLHACAIDLIPDDLLALQFNGCMMPLMSNNTAAYTCSRQFNIDSATLGQIIQCANSQRGQDLLVHYGIESKNANFSHVPYVLINGEEFVGDDFFRRVCDSFIDPPKACSNAY